MISFFGKYSCCLIKVGFSVASYYFIYFTTCVVNEIELFTNVLGSRYCNTLEAAIVVFAFMFVVYILGLAAVISDSTSNLKTIGIIYIILLIPMLAIGVEVLELAKLHYLRNDMETGFKNTQNECFREQFNDLQQRFHCCGINGPNDYESVPKSCCRLENEPCNGTTINQLYELGCYPVLSKKLYIHMTNFSFVCYSTWGMLLVSSLASFWYGTHLNKQLNNLRLLDSSNPPTVT